MDKFIRSYFTQAFCAACNLITEHLCNVFESGNYYVCQTCGGATVARKRNA